VIAVAGKASFYYLPLTVAEQLGYFKAEGVDVELATSPAARARSRRWWAAAPTS
jgi:ABC-type nitrate/sulfonate/bicarbonate transport system substrate-binding protein